MNRPSALFEVSWEVCNKVGGIHTVVSSKAQTLVDELGDGYVCVGPWLLCDVSPTPAFESEPGFEAFEEACREAGTPVMVGRWNIPGRPRVLLVEFSGLYEQKDRILGELWSAHQVDSIAGDWDYVEPVLFGYAAGQVIERWWTHVVADSALPVVTQCHEWMTASAALYLHDHVPEMGTVFTTHATVLGRAFGSHGHSPEEGLAGRTPGKAALDIGVRAKHSMEGTAARVADVFTTVSEITATEATLLHERAPDPLLPNGIDLDGMDSMTSGTTSADARLALRNVAERVLGEDLADAAFLVASGRYEFHNKGLDLVLDALADVSQQPGRPIVLFMLVPAGNSGLRRDVVERMGQPLTDALALGPVGVTTHTLFHKDSDEILLRCREHGFDNANSSRVRVIHVAAYLDGNDGLFDLPYEVLLQGMDLSCFPSTYEPWGYTPQESLAVGVPTVTSDLAGFGRWCSARDLGADDGVHVIRREGRSYDAARADLADLIGRVVGAGVAREDMWDACRGVAELTSWSGLIDHYREAFSGAIEASRGRRRTASIPLRHVESLPVRPTAQSARPRLFPIEVAATLPESLTGLNELAANWAWVWDPDAPALFEELSPITWERCRHNPVRLIEEAPYDDFLARADDDAYLARLAAACQRLVDYIDPDRERPDFAPLTDARPAAYFCAEFGLHESLPIYSGGLGVLAGDHLRSASDLDVPLVAVGLLYRKGYMRQGLADGIHQTVSADPLDPLRLALEPVVDEDGDPIEVLLQLPGTLLRLRAWRATVGRISLYLLDTDVEGNRPADRGITHALYGGDEEMRIRQEIVLGRGGVRLLWDLGIHPAAFHLNEGHAAFAPLERVHKMMRHEELTFDEAREVVRATTAFTTHTPVPAGHDRFSESLVRRYFSDAETWVGLPWEKFLELGQAVDTPGILNMTALALHFASSVNAVSEKHGEVSRELLGAFVPQLLAGERPVAHVTNGIHLGAWTAPRIAALVGAGERRVTGADFADNAESIDLGELWAARLAEKSRFLDWFGGALRRWFTERHDSLALLETIVGGVDENALWIGFARRFATYKRADLMFRDPARLLAILSDPERPVRIVIAGKAHPRDGAAGNMLARVNTLLRSEEFAGKVFFAEDYDMAVARRLVRGVDVWMNNPRPPLEASGTSGMKAAANGVLNLSVGDGWWLEGYDGMNGWTIGEIHPTDGLSEATSPAEQERQDAGASASLYRLLEEEIAPLYYDRDEDGVPVGWMEMARHSLATLPATFCTERMVGEYAARAYLPLATAAHKLEARGYAAARKQAAKRDRLCRGLRDVRIVDVTVETVDSMRVGDDLRVRVDVDLGALDPDDVRVELVFGPRDLRGGLKAPSRVELSAVNGVVQGTSGAMQRFAGSRPLDRSGACAYGVRVRMRNGDELTLHEPVIWA